MNGFTLELKYNSNIVTYLIINSLMMKQASANHTTTIKEVDWTWWENEVIDTIDLQKGTLYDINIAWDNAEISDWTHRVTTTISKIKELFTFIS